MYDVAGSHARIKEGATSADLRRTSTSPALVSRACRVHAAVGSVEATLLGDAALFAVEDLLRRGQLRREVLRLDLVVLGLAVTHLFGNLVPAGDTVLALLVLLGLSRALVILLPGGSSRSFASVDASLGFCSYLALPTW